MDKHLHIVCMDVPYPADYGGVVDPCHKIRCLHGAGVKIHLHCFEYGRGQSLELNKYCEEVYYYQRNGILNSMFGITPYIVSSRKNNQLEERLTKDDYPILFEGLHTCHSLNHPLLAKKRKVARMHNIEWMYYDQLAKQEKNIFGKTYYHLESLRLKKFEAILTQTDAILAINLRDSRYFEQYKACHTLYPFHSNVGVSSQLGKGDYVLYHGNLSVNENIQAVFSLLEKVVAKLPLRPFVIAGKEPSPTLAREIARHKNVRLISNPSQSQLEDLIEKAHIHLLATFQSTGVKLKLLHALFSGRHCLANSAMTDGLNVLGTCWIEDNLGEWPAFIEQLFEKDFDLPEKERREALFRMHFDNVRNAEKLSHILFDDKKE